MQYCIFFFLHLKHQQSIKSTISIGETQSEVYKECMQIIENVWVFVDHGTKYKIQQLIYISTCKISKSCSSDFRSNRGYNAAQSGMFRDLFRMKTIVLGWCGIGTHHHPMRTSCKNIYSNPTIVFSLLNIMYIFQWLNKERSVL